MRAGSLFSGVGGFDLGLELAGHEIVWQVEFDKQCRSVLRHHWPNVDLYEDVNDVGGADDSMEPSRARCVANNTGHEPTSSGQYDGSGSGDDIHGGGTSEQQRTTLASVDLICGGFPCQDLSVAGGRKGLAGERSGLWGEFHRLIGELSPTWLLIENVPGLLSSNDGRDMGVVVRGLEELGYGWSYRILDSQYFGVPQRRRRVFIVGHSGGVCGPEILLECESVCGDIEESHAQGEDVAGTSGESPACPLTFRKATKQPDYDRWEDTELAGTLVGHDLGSDTRTSEVALVETYHDLAPTMFASGAGTERTAAAESEAQFIVGAMPRRLTPRECERLQGFPDDWTRYADDGTELADAPRYRMMGNAVTVNVAEWIGRRFL